MVIFNIHAHNMYVICFRSLWPVCTHCKFNWMKCSILLKQMWFYMQRYWDIKKPKINYNNFKLHRLSVYSGSNDTKTLTNRDFEFGMSFLMYTCFFFKFKIWNIWLNNIFRLSSYYVWINSCSGLYLVLFWHCKLIGIYYVTYISS